MVCPTGLQPPEKQEVQDMVEEMGGVFNCDLDQQVTHLVCGAHSDKPSAKYMVRTPVHTFSKSKHDLFCVGADAPAIKWLPGHVHQAAAKYRMYAVVPEWVDHGNSRGRAVWCHWWAAC